MDLSDLMVNFFREMPQSGRPPRCRTTVTLSVNKLATARIGEKESSRILGLARHPGSVSFPRRVGSLFDNRWSVRLRPSEVLPAIECDHLTGHRRRAQYEAQRRRNLLRAGTAPQRHCRALPGEFLRTLPSARQRRTGSDAVHPDARREG